MNQALFDKFQKILEERMEALQNHIQTASTSIAELSTQSSFDQADVISANTQGILNSSLIQQHQKELQDINRSLEKIKNKTFGLCEMCGDEINQERLEIKPHAKYCIICREIYEKTKN